MTDRIEGDYHPTDHDDLSEWLHSIRREDTIETAFRENASTLVGWFCLLLDEVERLTDLNTDLEDRFRGPDEECDDPRCAFCWPSYTCSSECDHEWIRWDDDDPNAWTFCAQCGIKKEDDVTTDPYEGEYCKASNWAHDWVKIGDFRADNGELISGNADGRRICRDCYEVEPPKEKKPQQYLSPDGPNIEPPLDNGPELLDPAVCEHEGWTTFSTGWVRCKGCASWIEPPDLCPFGHHDPVAIGVRGSDPQFVCSLCHKQFDGKKPPTTTAPKPPVVEAKVDLPDPVAHPSRKADDYIFTDSTAKEMVRGEIKIGPSEDAPTGTLKINNQDDPCPECGWADPHSHVKEDGTTNHPAIPLPVRTPKVKPWDDTLYDHVIGCTNRNVRYFATGGCKCPAYEPTPDADEEETAFTDESMSSTQRALVAAAMVWHGYAHR